MRINFQQAVKIVSTSGIVAIPTETVWGLAAKADDELAVRKIFETKRRPQKNPLIIHLSEGSQIYGYLSKGDIAGLDDLIAAFWPGPLTVVVPVRPEKVLPIVRSHLATAAFRVPALSSTRALLRSAGPLVAPSANISGKPSSTTIADIESDFGQDFPCFFPEDGIDEQSELGVESTILVYGEKDRVWRLGRRGALPLDMIEALLHQKIEDLLVHSEMPVCPGQMFRHYAPEAKLQLIETLQAIPDEAVVMGFSDRNYAVKKVYTLGHSHNMKEVLRNLYTTLRKLDHDAVAVAYIDCQPPKERDSAQEYLWNLFLDRLQKAQS